MAREITVKRAKRRRGRIPRAAIRKAVEAAFDSIASTVHVASSSVKKTGHTSSRKSLSTSK